MFLLSYCLLLSDSGKAMSGKDDSSICSLVCSLICAFIYSFIPSSVPSFVPGNSFSMNRFTILGLSDSMPLACFLSPFLTSIESAALIDRSPSAFLVGIVFSKDNGSDADLDIVFSPFLGCGFGSIGEFRMPRYFCRK